MGRRAGRGILEEIGRIERWEAAGPKHSKQPILDAVARAMGVSPNPKG